MGFRTGTALAAVVLAACGASTGGGASRPATTAPAHAAVAPAVPSHQQMLEALPADAKLVLVIDVQKLRHSELARRAWARISQLPKTQELLATLCGSEDKIDYVLMAMTDMDGHDIWGWMTGIDSTAKFTCAKAKDDAKREQTHSVTHGAYTVETSTTAVTESIWLDRSTGFFYQHPAGPHVGEQRLRDAVKNGGGFSKNTALTSLFDHFDFHSGLGMVFDASQASIAGLAGMTISVEADSDLRVQGYIVVQDEDHASDLHDQYRTLLQQLQTAHAIDNSEVRADGSGLAVSLTLTEAQLDWWITLAIQKSADPQAPVPPPPGATQTTN